MNQKQLKALITAGVFSASMMTGAVYAKDAHPKHTKATKNKMKKMMGNSCAGQNSCKGKGGCKTGDAGCRGKNSCKGKGGCATDGSHDMMKSEVKPSVQPGKAKNEPK